MMPSVLLAVVVPSEVGPEVARAYEGPGEVAADADAIEAVTPVVDEPRAPEAPAPTTALEPDAAQRDAQSQPASAEGGLVEPERAASPRRRRWSRDRPRDGRARTWAVGGFVDTGYTFDHNLPDNHIDRGNFTSLRSNEITVHLTALYVNHPATDDEPWSFEVAAQFGTTAAGLIASEPNAGGDQGPTAGREVWEHVGRANVGARIPKTGTELAVGVFGTPIGIWSLWSKDNWTYSTPWHLNAVPYVLMAGRVTQPIGRKVVTQLWITNGWQTYGDLNRLPSTMVGGTYTPVDDLALSTWTYFGPEDVDNRPRAWRLLSDTYAIYDRDRWAIAAVFDVGRERLTGVFGEPVALWMAGAMTVRGRVWQGRRKRARWDMSGRGELFWDRDGRMFGVRQRMWSATYGNGWSLFDHLQVRIEYRYDRSSNPAGYFYRGAAITDDADGLGTDQHSVFFALVGMFEHRFATRRE